MKNRIEEIRKERGIRQEDFARLMGVSRQTISSLETGKYNPSIFLAYKIAKYFSIKPKTTCCSEKPLKSNYAIIFVKSNYKYQS